MRDSTSFSTELCGQPYTCAIIINVCIEHTILSSNLSGTVVSKIVLQMRLDDGDERDDDLLGLNTCILCVIIIWLTNTRVRTQLITTHERSAIKALLCVNIQVTLEGLSIFRFIHTLTYAYIRFLPFSFAAHIDSGERNVRDDACANTNQNANELRRRAVTVRTDHKIHLKKDFNDS